MSKSAVAAVPERIKSIALWSSMILLPLVLFLLITPYNEELFLYLNDRLGFWGNDSLWVILTNLGDGFLLFPFAMVLFRRKHEQQLTVLISMILLALAINISKHWVGAPRPAMALDGSLFSVIGPLLKSDGFPSGHAGTAFLLAGLAFIYLRPPLQILVLILMGLVGLSRIAVGAHWPVDVVAGAWVGLMCALSGCWISHRLTAGLKTRLLFIVLGVLALTVLPGYNNGFEQFVVIRILEYLLAAVAAAAVLYEVFGLYHYYRHRLVLSPDIQKTFKYRLNQLIRFSVVGSSGFLVDMGIYTLLSTVTGISHLFARALSYWCSASWNWTWNRSFTFSDAEKVNKLPQWSKYIGMCVISFVPNWGTYYLLTESIPFFDQYHQLALITGVAAGMVFNFTLASLFIFTVPKATRGQKAPQHES